VIDFKYHVVSIVAVFLALAVGIVLGTNVLSGDVLKNLKTQTSDLRKQAQDLRAQNQQQQGLISTNEDFLRGLEPMAVAGLLAGRHVAVVSVPDAPKSVRDDAVKTLGDAGAIVTVQVDLDAAYDDPAHASTLDSLLKSLATPTFDPTAAGDVAARAASILASALVGDQAEGSATPPASSLPRSTPPASPTTTASSKKTSGSKASKKSSSPSATTSVEAADAPVSPPPSSAPPDNGRSVNATSTEILAGLQKAGFLKLDQQPLSYADMVVVVGGAAPAKATPSPTPTPDTALLDIIAALQREGSQAVVIGPDGSADDGGLVAQVRSDSSLSRVVSAVDDANSAGGLIAMVLALRAQVGGAVGQYGRGQGAQAPLPTASLTPAAPGGL
jgi:hypothetical protein